MKRFKLALGLFIILVICAVGFTACNTTEIDKQRENGKIITVTYDSNGGKMLQRDGVSLIDMIDPDDYTADSEGNISIKLLDPTDARRTHGNMLEKVSVTKSGYFLAGWYQTRTVKVNADDEPIDDNGRVLKENLDGTFNYKDPKNKDEASINVTPAYNYDDLWDFNEDVITYKKGSGKKDITLYAGWVMNFKFEFYTVTEAGTTLAATYSFNYLDVEAAPEKGIDKIAIPSYTDNNGGRTPAMNYSLKNNSTTNFPSIQGKTFEAAYSDEACTEMITGDTVTHGGSMDYEKGAGVNPVKKIYAKYSEGEVYKIKTAKITNVTFENISYDMAAGTSSGTGKFGSFAGNIEEGAELTNVTLTGVILRIGAINYNAKYTVNLIANGDISKLNIIGGISSVKLEIYGKTIGTNKEDYYFTVKIAEKGEDPNPAKYVTRDTDGKVTFELNRSLTKSGKQEVYEIR